MTGRARRPLVAGNWKMNGLRTVGRHRRGGAQRPHRRRCSEAVDVLICPPATLICVLRRGGLRLAASPSAARTATPRRAAPSPARSRPRCWPISAPRYVIVGHSERRAYHGETDDGVHAKALGARRAGLCGIVCVGETQEEREAGQALDIVRAQLAARRARRARPRADTVIAYEPVWAIGTGLTPTPADIAEVHASLREMLGQLVGARGGRRSASSTAARSSPATPRELMAVANVDGALVGGASLKAEDFLAIARGLRAERAPRPSKPGLAAIWRSPPISCRQRVRSRPSAPTRRPRAARMPASRTFVQPTCRPS